MKNLEEVKSNDAIDVNAKTRFDTYIIMKINFVSISKFKPVYVGIVTFGVPCSYSFMIERNQTFFLLFFNSLLMHDCVDLTHCNTTTTQDMIDINEVSTTHINPEVM